MLLVSLAGATDDDLESLERVLTDAERSRFSRVLTADGRIARVAARAAARLVLAERLGVPPSGVPIDVGDSGKPRVAGTPSQAFNVSHTRGLVAAAFADEGDVGVDVEQLRARDVERLTRRSFAQAEADFVNATEGDERARRFYDVWTAKEAWLKARGSGNAFHLTGFEVDPLELSVRDPDEPRTGRLARLEVPDGYAGAVAVIGAAPAAPRTRLLSVIELARSARQRP
ncbi:MAG: 4'-phosphopantetheinyl transferase family protein [Thermoleophilaceae bacterium]